MQLAKQFFLTGPKVGLRALSLDDLDGNYVSWLNDPEVCQFNSHHVYPYSREEAEKFVRSTLGDRSRIVLAVELLANGQHIGNVSLQNINFVDRNAEFAILMGEKSCWGKGYSKEASRLLVEHGFSAMNLHRIYCGTNENNLGMQKLALYLGMKTEGQYRHAQYKNGTYVDIKRYGLIRREFLQQEIEVSER